MEQNRELLNAISSYCNQHNFQKTLKSLNEATGTTAKNYNDQEHSVLNIFEKYFTNEHEEEGLSFTFNLQNKRSQLRNRLLEQSVQTVVNKKAKVGRVKERKNEVPDSFLLLLDELGLDRKKAKLLYENKDQWRYEKSDRLIYCTEHGIFLLNK